MPLLANGGLRNGLQVLWGRIPREYLDMWVVPEEERREASG